MKLKMAGSAYDLFERNVSTIKKRGASTSMNQKNEMRVLIPSQTALWVTGQKYGSWNLSKV
jgi:hypothetical protein